MGWGVSTSADDTLAGNNKLSFFPRYQTLFAFILFIFLSAIALGANPFAAQTVAPLDLLLNFPGYASQRDHKTLPVVHEERNDIIDSQLPTWMTLKDQIRNGGSPLWYPNAAGGHPTTLTLSNPTFLLFLGVEDDALAYYFVALAKLIISGFGMYLLLRTHLRWMPSVWGGIVFMLCGFNAAWFFWEQVSTAMWIPWLLWATVLYLKTEETKWLPAIAVSSLLLIFGGFPAVAAFGFFAFSLLLLVWNIPVFFGGYLREARYDAVRLRLFLKKAGLPLIAVGMAFLMSAVTIIPFIDYMSELDLLSYRTGATAFSAHDLFLLFSYEDPPRVERTAYVGILAVILAFMGIFSAFRAGDKNLRLFILFNALLVLVSLLMAFGLLPHGLIRALPVFKTNPWGRLIVVTLLGLAALSAVGLDFVGMNLQTLSVRYLRLSPLNAQRIIAAAMIGILAVQFHAQKKLFNSFNAVVPSSWFYPVTPSLAHVKERLDPLQSVIVDDSYGTNGTLGAYGIAEWYAHSWRTEREKAVLSDLVRYPFVTATAASIVGFDIQYNSPLMDKLGIKYVLVNKNAKLLFVQPELSHTPAPPLPDNALRQHIYLQQDMVIGSFGFLFSKYSKKHSQASVRLALSNDKGEKYPFESELAVDKIVNNQWAFFELPDKIYLKEGAYSLELSLVDASETDKLTVWATTMQNYTGSYLAINGVSSDVTLKFKMIFYEKNVPDILDDKWNVINLEKDIVILENKQVTNSAYFIQSLDAANDRIDFSGLQVKQVSEQHINIDYSKRDTGWIVLPMRLDPGWKAYVDDRQVNYDAYLGILPAIPVQGPSRVIFKYQSESFLWGIIVSSAGLFTLLIFSWRCLRAGQRRDAA